MTDKENQESPLLEEPTSAAEKDSREFPVPDTETTSPSEKKPRKTYRKRAKTSKVKGEKTYGILIVEDEKSWKNVYKINLFKNIKQKRKIKFYEASNAKEALKILVQFYDRIQVMILDLVMGATDESKSPGMVLLETIVDRFGLKDLGIFVITAYGSQETQEQCYLRGVRSFQDKSQLDFEKLSSLIDNYLELEDKEKGTEVGFYAESRLQKDQRYLYLRWKRNDGSFDLEYIANMAEIERIVIPNMITDLNTLEGLKQVEDE